MHTRLTAVPNRMLLYDMYQYVWDAKETTMLLDSYIAWLGKAVSSVFYKLLLITCHMPWHSVCSAGSNWYLLFLECELCSM